jgi:hypothetical protein
MIDEIGNGICMAEQTAGRNGVAEVAGREIDGGSRSLALACPLEGLVGWPSWLKKAAPLVHLLFVQYHAGF